MLKKLLKKVFGNRIYDFGNSIVELQNRLLSDKHKIKRDYKKVFHKNIDLDNPQTLNEKINWLKLHEHKKEYTKFADKYLARDFIVQNFGEQYLVPLEAHFKNLKEMSNYHLPDYPVVIKSNNGSGTVMIIKDRAQFDFNSAKKTFKKWLKDNYYYRSCEYQYKHIKNQIIVEKLLLNKEGKIPNDYKLNFFNGKLVMIYCSIDREGDNYRQMFDENWKRLPFDWSGHMRLDDHPDIERPLSFDKMVEIGKKVSAQFDYVRVDFYDVDGRLYCGEITLHHGSGLDPFYPNEYDLIYGQKLSLTNLKRK